MRYYLHCAQFTYQQHAANRMGSPSRNRRDIWSELGRQLYNIVLPAFTVIYIAEQHAACLVSCLASVEVTS